MPKQPAAPKKPAAPKQPKQAAKRQPACSKTAKKPSVWEEDDDEWLCGAEMSEMEASPGGRIYFV